jgi:hypothetical protein
LGVIIIVLAFVAAQFIEQAWYIPNRFHLQGLQGTPYAILGIGHIFLFYGIGHLREYPEAQKLLEYPDRRPFKLGNENSKLE